LRKVQHLRRLVEAAELMDGEEGAEIEQFEINAHFALK
jgi:hypothetical protein